MISVSSVVQLCFRGCRTSFTRDARGSRLPVRGFSRMMADATGRSAVIEVDSRRSTFQTSRGINGIAAKNESRHPWDADLANCADDTRRFAHFVKSAHQGPDSGTRSVPGSPATAGSWDLQPQNHDSIFSVGTLRARVQPVVTNREQDGLGGECDAAEVLTCG